MAQKRKTTPQSYDFETIVIGSGPSGSTAAEILAHGGQRVAVVEAETLGGECLNYGCIPTKSMLSVSHLFSTVKEQKAISNQGLLKLRLNKLVSLAEENVSKTGAKELSSEFSSLGISVLKGRAYFIDQHKIDVAGKTYRAKNFIIATGGEVVVPNIPGLDGLDYLTYKNFLSKVKERNPKSISIIGGGAVGCEYAQILSSVGVKVNIIESAPRILADQEPEASTALQKHFESLGVKIYLNSRVVAAGQSSTGNLKELQIILPEEGQIELKTDSIMVAVGKKMRDGDGLSNAGIHCENGLIVTNSFCQTVRSHIYAIGDTAGPYRLTSTALMQAKAASANILSSVKGTKNLSAPDYSVVPSAVFTNPEIARVGKSTKYLKEQGVQFKQALVPLSQITRSKLEDDLGGFVKIWSHPTTKVILGACLVGPGASEQVAVLALAIKLKIPANELTKLTQVFPTWSEAIGLASAEL